MEADRGKSVPVLKEFQMEALLAPVTPAKPMVPGLRPIHPNRQQALPNQGHMTEKEAYLSRFTHQNPAEMSANIGGSIQFEAGQAEGWAPLYGPPTKLSESSNSNNHTRGELLSFSRDDVMYENGGAQDPLAQWSAMRFSDLLAMNNQGATASGGNQPAMISTGFFSNLASQFEPMNGRPTALVFENQDVMGGNSSLIKGTNKTAAELREAEQFHQNMSRQLNQKTDIQQSGFSDNCWKSYDLNFHPNAEDAVLNGNRHANATNVSLDVGAAVFAPATPDPQKSLANKSPMNQIEIQFSSPGNDSTLGIQETQPTANSTAMENYDHDNEGNQDLDLNKTTQEKPRKKKHRPKVIKEGKPKRTPTQRKSEPGTASETPKPKRKYVRKNKTSTPSATPPEGAEAVESKTPDPAAKSCRRALNFDLEDQVNENSFSHGSASIPPSERCPQNPQEDKDALAGATNENYAYDVCSRNNQILKDYLSMQERVAQNVQHPTDLFECNPNSNTCASSNAGEHTRGLKRANFHSADATNMGRENLTAPSTPSQVNHVFLGTSIFSGAHGMYFPTIHKKRRTEKLLKPNTSGILSYAYALENIKATASSWSYSREAAKSSKYYYPAPHFSFNADPNNQGSAVRSSEDNTVFMNWGDIDKLKKKRSKAPTRVRNLDSLKGLADCRDMSRPQAKQRVKRPRKKNVETFNSTPSMQALALVGSARQTGKRKPRKKTTSANSITSSFDMLNNHNLDLVSGAPNSNGTFLALPWIDTVYVDAVIEGMKQLNINKESSSVQYQEQNALIPYHIQYQQQNALVLYQRDGTMIPFGGTQASKRRQRAKVDLDDETSKVWRLLLEDINNQGIDGTDEEKAKWWENERKVFHGRVDSFIARMRLVQGDRRFSPWKGSVVDSVVGVFLTQNVSDHLSSSAFMSLASRFPVKAADKFSVYSEEKVSPLVEEPEISIVDLDENSEVLPWNERIVQGPARDMNSKIYLDIDVGDDKVVDSKQFYSSNNLKDDSQDLLHISQEKPREPASHPVSGTNKNLEVPSASPDTQVTDDVTSSQHSVISSQNSVESPRAQTSGKMGLSSDNSSEGEDLTTSTLNCSASFVELIKMAETPMLHTAYAQSDHKPSYQSDLTNQKGTRDEPLQKAAGAGVHDSLSVVQHKCSAIYQLHPEEEHCSQGVDEESRSVSSARLSKNFTAKQSEAAESTGEFVLHEKTSRSNQKPHLSADNVCSCYVLEGEEMVIQSLKQPVGEQQGLSNSQTEGSEVSPPSQKLSISSGETVTESTCASNSTPYPERKDTPPHSDHNQTQGETSNALKKTSERQKTGRTVKKAPPYDWDSLRKQTRVDGQTRPKTDKTMDSLDWEAVRCADVREIADTIKERGMNNVLAERIQEFLNRLVKDHGSIDLEWLRDVPPDKAKEYLLSIRGLGLKSVECVRLLTLHHLAFPVDTNVGRIAVRLGWVPLQPLPESLQLHLLELYPILESIQKYLWPRLCKLDQRTLYELHYHMITFGKVFCTKKQPNCNACPLRGECRHFASAFASARLALPGPEDKSIVPSERSGVAHQDPQVTISPVMSLPMPNQISEAKADATSYEPIVEIPASPEPDRTEASECDIGDIEDLFNDDPNEIPTIRLNMEEFTNTLQTYMQANMELQGGDMSRALVALAAEAASIPTPKLKNVSRLRTEHHVYELPDTHQLIRELDRREPDDPCSYLLAIWSPGETANSTETPQKRCSSEEPGQLCFDETCSYCNSQREANSQVVRGTLLVPCRTAMRGSFPLNGTYFQVNEVFADHDSSLNPIEVPRTLIWNLPRRTVYFGTSIPTIFKGLTTEDIQHCFWRGYVCVRGFDQRTRAPRPLMARLHYPASKMVRPRGRNTERNS